MRLFLIKASAPEYAPNFMFRCEELRDITRRLVRVLPGTDLPSMLPDVSPGWACTHTVIEAKPVHVGELDVIGGRLTSVMPPNRQCFVSRRAFVRNETRTATVRTDEPVLSNSEPLPRGVILWHAPDEARKLLVLAIQDARSLFSRPPDELCRVLPATLDDEGTITAFADLDRDETDPCNEMCLRDSLRVLRERAPYVARLAEEYARSLCWMYGVGAHEFQTSCRLRLEWIQPGYGRDIELQPMSSCRYENGPVVHVGIGRPYVVHDLVPSLPPEVAGTLEKNLRLVVPEGVMVALDGAVRARYSHGHPAEEGRGGWLGLTFLLDCTPHSFPSSYERETRAVIMETPVVPDRVVCTCIDAKNSRKPPVAQDCFGLTLGRLRRLVRSAESHLMAEKCLLRARERPPGAAA